MTAVPTVQSWFSCFMGRILYLHTDKEQAVNTPPPQDNRWHLDKKVPVGIILVLLFQGVAGIWAIADIKKDVELLKDNRVEQRDRDARQDRAATEAVNLVRSDIRTLGEKLDRLIERTPR